MKLLDREITEWTDRDLQELAMSDTHFWKKRLLAIQELERRAWDRGYSEGYESGQKIPGL